MSERGQVGTPGPSLRSPCWTSIRCSASFGFRIT